MNIVEVHDLDMPGLEPYARLTEAQLRNRLHPADGLFLCESMKVIDIALAHGLRPASFLCEEKFLPTLPPTGATVYTGRREVLRGLTGYELSRGVLCAMHRPQLPPADELLCGLDGRRRVAVMDGVVNSENTGALFRAAAALGIDAVLPLRPAEQARLPGEHGHGVPAALDMARRLPPAAAGRLRDRGHGLDRPLGADRRPLAGHD